MAHARCIRSSIDHGIAPTPRLSRKTALLLLDADANLGINRRLFGATLRGLTVRSRVRQAYVIQISNATLVNSTLAPGPGLPNNSKNA